MKYRKVRAGSNDKLSASAWNATMDLLNQGDLAGQAVLPSALQNSFIVNAVSDGQFGPFEPVRVMYPLNMTEPQESKAYKVESIGGNLGPGSWCYGFTMGEGVGRETGGRVVIGGIAIVKVNKTDLQRLGSENPWDRGWYNILDRTVGSETIGPVGHFKIVSPYDTQTLQQQNATGSKPVYIAVDMSTRPSSVFVNITSRISASSSGLMHGRFMPVHSVTDWTGPFFFSGQLTTQNSTFEVMVYNPYEYEYPVTERARATWSTEFQCYLLEQDHARIVFCKPTANISANSSGTCKVWAGDPLSETSENITVHLDWIHGGEGISAGKACVAVFLDGVWRFIAADCEEDGEVGVKVGKGSTLPTQPSTYSMFYVPGTGLYNNNAGVWELDLSASAPA